MKEKAPIQNYYALRNTIDNAAATVAKEHQPHMQCRKGCDLCCMAIRVFPVEFYAIMSEQEEFMGKVELPKSENEFTCQFLVNHECSIYRSRPIICRTHGLPLLYMNSEGTAWELSHCELNFNEKPVEDFHTENTLVMDTFNSRLFQINQTFVSENEHLGYSKTDRIPLAELLNQHEISRLS